jgi:hypothetical protein
MDYNALPIVVLTIVLVGLLVGVGVLAQDKMIVAVRESVTTVNESFTTPVTNGTVTLTKGGNISSIVQIVNASNVVWNAKNYKFDVATGKLNNSVNNETCENATTCYATYIYYEYGTDAGNTLISSRDAVGTVSTTWMSLVVTIAILAVIIGLVIGGFAFRRNR